LLHELVFVGLGLNSEKGISLAGLEEAKSADAVFMELYTSLLPDFSLKNLETLIGKSVQFLSRHNLEDENGKAIFDVAKTGKAVFLVPGDPFIATTHVTLRIEAAKQKIPTRIVHGASIISAIVSVSGLENYKFGITVTIPFPENFSETPYNVIAQNKQLGLNRRKTLHDHKPSPYPDETGRRKTQTRHSNRRHFSGGVGKGRKQQPHTKSRLPQKPYGL
jgi:diphthine synthase